MKNSKIIYIPIIFIVLIFLFNGLEFGALNQAISEYFQSVIFSVILVVSVFRPSLRAKLFYLGFLFIFFTVILYLLGWLPLSNSFASIGIGIITMIVLTYLPELFKNGFVEKL